jgi:Leucine-rich repeat (LRR) protein
MKKTLSLIVLICLAWNLSALDLLRRGDSTALVTIFNNAGGMNWYNSAGWLTDGVPLEYWYGVTLENNRVVAIDLHSNNLSGTLQLALNLGMLRHLDVHDNPNLNGISSSVTNFINLRVLNLSNTKCGMPDDIGALVNLTYLNFYNNGITRIGGGGGSHLPSSISNLKKLEVLGLGKNHFNGPIPDFSGFNNLWWLDLADNDFSGSIPQSVATLPNLKALLLNDNSLSGSIPPMLWSRTTLELIRLDGNHELTGTISTSIGSLTELKVLVLSNNKMSGTIPSSIGNLTKLKELNLGANQFSGTIPTSIGNLTELEQLVLGENQLTGAIPDEIGNLVNIKYYLWLGNNQLSGSIPSTIGNLVNVVDLRLDRNNLSGESVAPRV